MPAEGRMAPVIRLKSVVLPAPFGPMNPQICFSGISKLTSFNAATPPKYLVSAWTTRISTFPPQQPEEPPQESQQAIRLQQNNDY